MISAVPRWCEGEGKKVRCLWSCSCCCWYLLLLLLLVVVVVVVVVVVASWYTIVIVILFLSWGLWNCPRNWNPDISSLTSSRITIGFWSILKHVTDFTGEFSLGELLQGYPDMNYNPSERTGVAPNKNKSTNSWWLVKGWWIFIVPGRCRSTGQWRFRFGSPLRKKMFSILVTGNPGDW